jgi:prevent-host-death family protein
MKQVNLYEAKTHLSRLVEEAERGEEIILARNGKPVAKLTALRESKPSDCFGMDRGKVWMAADFDETPDDFADYV